MNLVRCLITGAAPALVQCINPSFSLADHNQVIAFLNQPAADGPAFGFDLLIVGDVAADAFSDS